MSCVEVPLLWDRGVDDAGRPIRPDVRTAALVVWKSACKHARAALDDASRASQLMESSIAQISHYLDGKAVPMFSREIEGLVAHSFQRAVRRDLANRRRILSLDSSGQLSSSAADESWGARLQARVELQELVGLLSARSQTILALRYAGYSWKEVATVVGESVPALRGSFWRDVSRVRRHLEQPKV